MTPDDLVAACTATLEPLETAANAAWWDANVDATDHTQHLRSIADLALSDALADAEAFTDVRAARAESWTRSVGHPPARPADQSYTPNQVDADLRRETVELQNDIESRFARHRGTIEGESVDDNEILEVLRGSDDNRAPAGGVDRVEERGGRGRGRRAPPRRLAERSRTVARLPRPFRVDARDHRLRRGPSCSPP